MSEIPSQPPAEEAAPVEPASSPKSRFAGLNAEARRSQLQDLEWASAAGFDFFLFSLAGGLTLIAAILFDAAALYLLAALFIPFLGPLVGLALAAPTNSVRLFGRSLAAVLISSLFFFAAGAGAGLLSSLWPGLTFEQTTYHATFNWPDLLVLSVGSIFGVYSLVRSPRRRPLIANVALGYELFLPAGVAGFGLSAGIPGLWPDALIVAIVHMVFAVLLAMLAFWSARLHPRGVFGTALFIVILAVSIAAALLLSGFTSAARISGWPLAAAQPSATSASPTGLPSATVSLAASTQTTLPEGQSGTPPALESTRTPQPSPLPTETVRPTPAPAVIAARNGDGAFIRREPDSASRVLTSILNGNRVWILSTPVVVDETSWVQVRTEAGMEGWVVLDLLALE